MLIRFAVENFLSFKDSTEFSMIAGKMTRHDNHIVTKKGKRILKGAYVFGANASGKSNLIRAIEFAKDIVIDGIENVNCDKKYFRLQSINRTQPGVFQFDFYSGGHFYSYGFAVSYVTSSIEEEWLYRIDDKELCVFLRSKQENKSSFVVASDIKFKEKSQQDRFSVYIEDISNPKMDKTLFLSDIVMRSPDNEEEYKPFRDVMSWFKRLVIVFPESKYEGITQLLDNDDERTRLENLLNYFDTGISTVTKKELEFDKAFPIFPDRLVDTLKTKMTKQLKEPGQSAFVQHDSSLVEIKNVNGSLLAYEVVSNHGNDEDLFEYSDESDGTQRLFDLIPLYQKALKNSVILIDELDRSLHTKASQEFIKYFYSLTEHSSSQLIATTHDSNIMDLDFVRQDEIWFVERQSDCSSKLYSLNKFKVRFDKKAEKDYLLGRYGALPIFGQFVLESYSEKEDDPNARKS